MSGHCHIDRGDRQPATPNLPKSGRSPLDAAWLPVRTQLEHGQGSPPTHGFRRQDDSGRHNSSLAERFPTDWFLRARPST